MLSAKDNPSAMKSVCRSPLSMWHPQYQTRVLTVSKFDGDFFIVCCVCCVLIHFSFACIAVTCNVSFFVAMRACFSWRFAFAFCFALWTAVSFALFVALILIPFCVLSWSYAFATVPTFALSFREGVRCGRVFKLAKFLALFRGVVGFRVNHTRFGTVCQFHGVLSEFFTL